MIKDYVRYSYSNMKHRKIRSWLTMLGIFIGIASVVTLISLSQGLQLAIEEQFSELGTDKLIVQAAGGGFGPPGTGVPDPLTEDDKDAISKVRGVDLVVSRLIRIVQIEHNDEKKFTYATSISEDSKERELILEANNYKIDQGRFFEGSGSDVVIGANFAKDFFDEPLELRDKLLIQGESFKITGILEKSGNPQSDEIIVFSEKKMREILNIGDEIDIIPLRVGNGEDISQVKERVEKALRKQRDVEEGKEDFTVDSPEQIIETLQNIILVIQGILVGLATISLVVGGIGIMNTMFTAVYERTKEIGVLKAVGASKKSILFLFVFESGFLGLIGGLIGICFGVLLSEGIVWFAAKYENALLQTSFPPAVLFGVLFFAFLIGSLSGYLPARQASKLNPVEAFRK